MESEFWAAIVGAVVGGVIALVIQLIALNAAKKDRRSDQLERRKMLAHSLLFKIVKIHSSLHQYSAHLEQAFEQAAKEKFNGDP